MQHDASIRRNETANTEKAALHTIYKIRFDLKYNKIFSFHNTKQSHEIIFFNEIAQCDNGLLFNIIFFLFHMFMITIIIRIL